MSQSRLWARLWAIFLVVALVVGSFAVVLSGDEGRAEASSSDVTTGSLGANNVGGLAWIEPKSRVIRLGAPNIMEGARVEELSVEEGDRVKKGQVVGVFSTYPKNKAFLKVAESGLMLAQADLAKVKAGSRESDIASQKQMVLSLRASEEAATKEFKRLEGLYRQQLVTKSRYDTAKADMDSSVARRKAAEENLTSLEIVRPDDIAIAQSRVHVAESELAVARANLELSTIVAPIEGTVLKVYARNGEAVGDAGVMDIADLTVMDAVTEVDENDILKIKKGQKAEIRITGLDEFVKGTVREIGSQIKKNSVFDSANPSQMLDTRVVEVRVELDPAQNSLVSRLINKKARAVIQTSAAQ